MERLELGWSQQEVQGEWHVGKIVHYYYPGMVVVDGVPQAATKWKHWSLKEMDDPDSPEDAPETQSCASLVWQEFWVSAHYVLSLNHIMNYI